MNDFHKEETPDSILYKEKMNIYDILWMTFLIGIIVCGFIIEGLMS